ncbi:MAG: transposase [Candidatus Kapabacteria bacterium]|nr:transposase [Candidatus Kapabacteria bacterium]
MKGMLMEARLDLYTDYLLSSFGQTSATKLSERLDKALSHDVFTDMLATAPFDGRALWKEVKPLVRQIESEDGVVVVDDTIAHKPYSEINDLVSIHWDHSRQEYVRGINCLSLLYCSEGVRIPIGFEAVIKTLRSDLTTREEEWKSNRTKNEMFRDMLHWAYQNAVPFRYVLGDCWFSNAKNINAVLAIGKHYLGAIKSNTQVALSEQDRQRGIFVAINTLGLEPGTVRRVFLRSVNQAVAICRDVFINKDNSIGELFLLTTDLTQRYQSIISTYQKRWEVETYHKDLKQNAGLERSPARAIDRQSAHLFASVCAFAKFERLKIKEQKNHFALKGQLYIKALQAAFAELRRLQNLYQSEATLAKA